MIKKIEPTIMIHHTIVVHGVYCHHGNIVGIGGTNSRGTITLTGILTRSPPPHTHQRSLLSNGIRIIHSGKKPFYPSNTLGNFTGWKPGVPLWFSCIGFSMDLICIRYKGYYLIFKVPPHVKFLPKVPRSHLWLLPSWFRLLIPGVQPWAYSPRKNKANIRFFGKNTHDAVY